MASSTLVEPRKAPRFRSFIAGATLVCLAFLKRAAAPRSPSLANLQKMPLTVMGLGCIDIGVFTASSVAGWIVTGLSLLALEYMIADES